MLAFLLKAVGNGGMRRGLNCASIKIYVSETLIKQLSQVQDLECESDLVSNKGCFIFKI